MPDKISLNIPLFQNIPDSFVQQRQADFAAAAEKQEISERIKKHKEDIEIEKEEIAKEREEEIETEKKREPIDWSNKKEQPAERKKDSKSGRKGKNVEPIAEKIDPKQQELIDARKFYIETEFKERKALDEVRSYFNRKGNGEDKTETSNIRFAREAYEKILRKRMSEEVEALKAKGLTGETLQNEVKKLLKEYTNDKAFQFIAASR